MQFVDDPQVKPHLEVKSSPYHVADSNFLHDTPGSGANVG